MGQPTPNEFAVPHTTVRATRKEKAELVEAFTQTSLGAGMRMTGWYIVEQKLKPQP